MKILNKEDLDEWLFYRSVTLGHVCSAVKDWYGGELLNVAYIDQTTKEQFNIIYLDIDFYQANNSEGAEI